MTENSERRQAYTVSRPVQVIYTVTWLASIALLIALAMLVYSCQQLSERYAPEDVALFGVNGFIVVGALAAVLVAVALGACVIVVVHTHRMVGSSYRLRTVIEQLREGDWSVEARLRDGDYFVDVAEQLDGLIQETRPRLDARSAEKP